MKKQRRPENNDVIAALFEPRSIAVVGSLREGRFGGYVTTSHLIDFGYKGKIYPINPQYETVLGMKVYPRVRDIPESVDLAVMMTGAQSVPEIIQDCVENGTKVAIIVSDGFAERHEEGAKLQAEVNRIASKAGLRLLGPNTIGVANPAVGLVTTPYRVLYEKMFAGSIAICGQTGLIGPQNLPLEETRYGVSKICDFGNKCDIDEIDMLDYLVGDPETRVIAMHLEQIKDGRTFLDKVRQVVPAKPVLILKPGRTEESKKAMASHTGSLAGEDAVYDSAFKQAGAIRVDSLTELLEFPKVLASQPLPSGNRLAIITLSGGAGVMGIDVASAHGLTLAQFTPKTLDTLAGITPVLAGNPVDLGPALPVYSGGGLPAHYPKIVRAVMDDDNVDCVALACPWGLRRLISEIFGPLAGHSHKPMAVWVPSPSLSGAEEMCRALEGMGFPTYADGDIAIKALSVAYRYSALKSRFLREGAGSSAPA